MQRKRNRRKVRGPLIRLVGLNAAVASAGLAGSAALAAPGDLDPSFGDVGRSSALESNYFTSLQSIDVNADESVLFGGGGEYCYFGCYEEFFAGALLPDGTVDGGFAPPPLAKTVVRDTGLQSDGRFIAVGRVRAPDGKLGLTVFRMLRNGALDTSFGIGGLTTISNGAASSVEGHAVVIDPDDRIVVAGFRGSDLFVARFLANGTLDPGFGTDGVYSKSFPAGALALPLRIVRAAGGGYRVLARHVGTASGGNGCSVRGLTAAGDVDAGFGGASGVATLTGAGGVAAECDAIAVQSDGKLLLGGAGGGAPIGNGYLGRLLSNGAPDPGFAADAAVMAQLLRVTAIATGPGDGVYVGGFARNGEYGARVIRLQPDGALDPSYGRDGIARVDLEAPRPSITSIQDLQVLSDGRVVAGGNSSTGYWATTAFVARLLGAVGTSPGVLGMTRYRSVAPERDGSARLKVQRTGGRSGPVAVSFTARAFTDASATEGGDFTPVSGQLTWADGDDGEREIVVPVATDSTGEYPEFFEVVLTAPEGGAGLGAAGAEVEIADLGYPAGIFVLYPSSTLAVEGNTETFYVSRDSYAAGDVSVTLRVRDTGTAKPGDDFVFTAGTASGNEIVLTWADGQAGAKPVTVRLVSDSRNEGEETLVLELTSPTGGAALGEPSQASMRIQDPVARPPGGGGGGGSGAGGSGAWGGLGALLLGLAGLARRWRARVH